MKHLHPRSSEGGQVAILAVLFLLLVSLAIGFSFVFVVLREGEALRSVVFSKQVYAVGEGAVEDVTYRVKLGKLYDSTETVSLGAYQADVAATNVGQTVEVVGSGDVHSSVRTLKTVLANSIVGVSFFYGVQVGDGGLTLANGSQVNGNIYSNGSIGGSGTITGDAVVAGGISDTPTLEWPTHNADQAFATASTNRDIAQSFTATASDKLNRASVYLGKVGNPASSLTLRITADNGGKPATASLASATIAPASVGFAPAWADVSFAIPPTLSAGIKYWLVLDYNTNSTTDYWDWRKDTTDGYAGNTGRYTANWSASGAVWTNVGGDLAFRVWIGGVNTRIEGVAIGSATSGTGQANLFVNATVHGATCPNPYCIVTNPPREEMPIPEGVIQDWRNVAAAGGTCASPQCDVLGNYQFSNGQSGSLGPMKISGNISLSNNATLTVTGTLWVAGNVDLSNNCVVRLDPSYGDLSGVIVVDGTVTISNNCTFQGSGSPKSYVLLLSAKDAPAQVVVDVSNNSSGVIYYANKGRIRFSNNATAREATGYGIDLSNNAIITYDSGLANAQFSAGPSGSRAISQWREIP